MRRRLLNLLTVLSALLCVAVLVLWVRSYQFVDAFDVHHGRHRVGVRSGEGGLALGYIRDPSLAGVPASEVRWFWPAPARAAGRPGGPWAALGLGRGTVPVGRAVPVLGKLAFLGSMFINSVPADYVQMPWWPLAVAAAAGPCLRLRTAWRRRRRNRDGLCPQCGYDLRATPDRCRECVAVPTDPPALPGA